MEFPEDVRYTEEHEWLRVEGDEGVVGVTDYAQGELGDVVFLELPKPGTAVDEGSVFGTIEAVKTVSDLYAPVTGEITAVNAALGDKPELVNRSPYTDGWMVRIKLSDPGQAAKLMDAAAYRKHVGEEG
jgi:glycine cleavage system H protein